jgi:hypothetical protein
MQVWLDPSAQEWLGAPRVHTQQTSALCFQHPVVLMCVKRGGGDQPAIKHCLTHAQPIKAVASEASAPVYVQTLQQRAGFSLHAHCCNGTLHSTMYSTTLYSLKRHRTQMMHGIQTTERILVFCFFLLLCCRQCKTSGSSCKCHCSTAFF